MDFSNFIKRFPKVVEWYWNRKWKRGNVSFRMRSDSNKYSLVNEKLLVSVGQNFVWNTPRFFGSDEHKALSCWDWVKHHVVYETDKSQYGITEFWQTPENTLKRGRGDCEDMSLLLMKLMELNNIPAWKRKLCAGHVIVNGELVGHAYVIFLADDFEWYVLDVSYYPSLSKRYWLKTPHRKISKYGSVWFTFNEELIWCKHDYVLNSVEDDYNV